MVSVKLVTFNHAAVYALLDPIHYTMDYVSHIKYLISFISCIGLGPVLGVIEGKVLDNSAELVCTLACFSPNIQCKLTNIAIDGVKCELTPNYTTSSISGSSSSYEYPTQNITIQDLTSGTRYKYCVTGVNVSSGEMVDNGEAICGSFITKVTTSKNDGKCKQYLKLILRNHIYLCIAIKN